MGTSTIDFSKYEEKPAIDFSKYESARTQSKEDKEFERLMGQGMPTQADLAGETATGATGRVLKETGKDLLGAIRGMASIGTSGPESVFTIAPAIGSRYADAYLGARQAADQGNTTESMFKSAAVPFAPLGIDEIYDEAKAGNNEHAIGQGISRSAQLLSMAPEGSVIPNPLRIGVDAVRNIPVPDISMPEAPNLAAKARAFGDIAKREFTSRVPILNRIKGYTKPTLMEWRDAFMAKADPQLELFKNTPKLGDTPITPAQAETVATAESQVQAVPAGDVSTLPRVASGEGVLNKALTSLDNKSLLKIAKSRGIDVTQEAQLKPGAANGRLIKKISNDFSPDELDEIRNMGIEISQHMPVQNPNVTPEAAAEAWHYKVLNQFFPDVAIPKTMAARAQATIANRPVSLAESRFNAARAAAESKANAIPADEPQFAFRSRSVGDKGIMPHEGKFQAGLDQSQVEGYMEGRANVEGAPQELVRVDLSKLKPNEYEIRTNPDGSKWVKFKTAIPESFIEKLPPKSTTDWSLENMVRQIDLNKARRAKAGD